MPRDRTGTYTRAVDPYVSGNVISSHAVNQEMNDIAEALTKSLNTEGTAKIKGDLNMQDVDGTKHKHTSVARGTLVDDYADVGSVQYNKYCLLENARVINTNTLHFTTTPAFDSYVNGQVLIFNAPTGIEDVTQIQINRGSTHPVYGQITESKPHIVVYFTEVFYILSLSSGIVFPANIQDDDLLAYNENALIFKRIGLDVQAFSKALETAATAANAETDIGAGSKKLTNRGNILSIDCESTSAPTTATMIPVSEMAAGKVLTCVRTGTGDTAYNKAEWGALGQLKNITTFKRVTPDDGVGIPWEKPASLKGVKVTLIGGGGGGGCAPISNQNNQGRFSFSGGGGETVIAYIEARLITQDNLKIFVGKGGAGATWTSDGANGANGGNTQIKMGETGQTQTILLSAAGGAGGGFEPKGIIGRGNDIPDPVLMPGGAGGTTSGTDRGTLVASETLRIPGKAGEPTFRVGAEQQIVIAGGGDTIFPGGAAPTVSPKDTDDGPGSTPPLFIGKVIGKSAAANTGGGGGGSFCNVETNTTPDAAVNGYGAKGGNGAAGLVIFEVYG